MTEILLHLPTLLAQTTQPGPGGPAPTSTEQFFRLWMPLILVMAVFWWWMSRSKRRERQKFEDMLSSLKRNDKVQTIGGILGTVVETRGDEVIVKVDETSNVKLRFNRAAIKEVVRETPPEGQ